MNRYLVFVFFFALVIIAGIVVYFSTRHADSGPILGPMDLSMEKLRVKNPGLTFSQVGNHAHAFWATDPKTGKTVILPWEQSEDARVEIVPCADVPAQMLYARRSAEPVCLRITNEDGVLSAFSFHSPDNLMYEAVAFYDGNKKNDIRGTEHEQTGRYETLPDHTSRFLYSYYFHINPRGNEHPAGLAGFVGYKKEKDGK